MPPYDYRTFCIVVALAAAVWVTAILLNIPG